MLCTSLWFIKGTSTKSKLWYLDSVIDRRNLGSVGGWTIIDQRNLGGVGGWTIIDRRNLGGVGGWTIIDQRNLDDNRPMGPRR